MSSQKERIMKRATIVTAASLALIMPGLAGAQVAGSTLIGIAAAELREVTTGWSAKKQVLAQPVYNEKEEKIGTIDDIIVSPAKAVSYAIVGVGDFWASPSMMSPSRSVSSLKQTAS
jgi:hypothetical protein